MSHPLERYVAYVGRHKTYLEKPEMGTLPVSCTILVPDFSTISGISYAIGYISHALRTGAGINVHLDNFRPQPRPTKLASIRFELNSEHPEYQPTVNYQGWTTQLLEEPPLSGIQSNLSQPQVDPNQPQVVYVSDSMTEDNQSWYSDTLSQQYDLAHYSIEACLARAYEAGLYGKHITFNLSNLRPDSVANQAGMVSSGAISFAFMLARAYEFGRHQTMASLLAFLSSFNAVLRRGGTYKNGAITTSLPMWHQLAQVYLETPKEFYPWLKQGLVLPSDYLKFDHLLPLVYSKVNNGGLWLEKSVTQVKSETNLEWLASDDPRQTKKLRSNVCLKGSQRVVYKDEHGNITHPTIGELAGYQAMVNYNRHADVSKQALSGEVYNGHKWVPANFKIYGSASEFYKVETEDGTILEATKDHRWILEDGSERQSYELKVGMSLLTDSQPKYLANLDFNSLYYLHGYTAGFVTGDGHLINGSKAKLPIHEPKKVCIAKLQQALKAQKLSDEVKPIANTGHNKRPIWNLPGISHCELLAKYTQEYRKGLNPNLYSNSNLAFGFITGLFDADGTYQTAPKNKSIGSYSIVSVELDFLRQLKELLHVYGIESKVLPHTKAGTKDWGKRGGISNQKEAHRLITNCQNSFKLAMLCDFQRLPKPDSPGNTPRPRLKSNRIKSISVEHYELPVSVYSGQIEGEQYLLSNGIITGNCREILISDRSTCNLSHLNAGQINQFSELPAALSYVTEVLCKLHALGPQDGSGYYRPAKEDRQIGVGIVGLSNLLARHQIAYKELIVSLDRMLKLVSLKSIYKASLGQLELPKPNLDWRPADELSWWLIKAYTEASKVAREYNMERAFCIAPTANSSFRYEDLEYFTTSPEISPPIARAIERVSETQTEEDIFFYHPQAETAMEVGWHWYRQLVDTWQTLMNATGLGHSISFNIWQDINEEFLYWFASSNVVSTYYRLNVDTSSLNKADQFANSGPPISCACAG